MIWIVSWERDNSSNIFASILGFVHVSSILFHWSHMLVVARSVKRPQILDWRHATRHTNPCPGLVLRLCSDMNSFISLARALLRCSRAIRSPACPSSATFHISFGASSASLATVTIGWRGCPSQASCPVIGRPREPIPNRTYLSHSERLRKQAPPPQSSSKEGGTAPSACVTSSMLQSPAAMWLPGIILLALHLMGSKVRKFGEKAGI